MKRFEVFYAYYPFQVGNVTPDHEEVEAETIDEAQEKIREKYGNKIEIFTWKTREILKITTMYTNENDEEKGLIWWNSKSEDDQMFLMMKYGYSNPFNPIRVTTKEKWKMYELEKGE